MQEDFKLRLVTARKKLKISQEKAGEAIGMQRNNISLYESGNEPSFKYLMFLAECGIDMNWLFTGKESKRNEENLLVEYLVKKGIIESDWKENMNKK